MTSTRVYLPLTTSGLRRLAADREVGPAPVRAYAVTTALERAFDAGEREEELEYAAMVEAFEEAGTLAGTDVVRRVVVAADVDAAMEADPGRRGLGAVVLAAAVPLARVVSVHVDEDAGDEGLDDVLWFDVTELEALLADL